MTPQPTASSRSSRSSSPAYLLESSKDMQDPEVKLLSPAMERSFSSPSRRLLKSASAQAEGKVYGNSDWTKLSTPGSQYRRHDILPKTLISSPSSPKKSAADRVFKYSIVSPQSGCSSGQCSDESQRTLLHQRSVQSFSLEEEKRSDNQKTITSAHSASPVEKSLQSEEEDNSWTLKYTHGVENKVFKIVELLPGTNIYVSQTAINSINRTVKGQKQMARQLLDAIFTRDALRTCSLSGRPANGIGKKSGPPRPGLHQEAKTVLIEYVQQTAATQKWSPVADQLILQSLRAKLNEIRDSARLNQKMEK